jgi:hypothetical protein
MSRNAIETWRQNWRETRNPPAPGSSTQKKTRSGYRKRQTIHAKGKKQGKSKKQGGKQLRVQGGVMKAEERSGSVGTKGHVASFLQAVLEKYGGSQVGGSKPKKKVKRGLRKFSGRNLREMLSLSSAQLKMTAAESR